MNEEYLNQFDYQQLVNYEALIKRRIKDMKELVVPLQQANSELCKEYKSLMEQKRILSLESRNKQKFWNKIVHSGKSMMTNIFVKSKKQQNPYQPQMEHKPYKLQQKQDILQQIEKNNNQLATQIPKKFGQPIVTTNSSPNRVINPPQLNGFNFDDIYVLGKEKITKMAHASGQKLKDISAYGSKIKQYIKQKVNPSSSSDKQDILNQEVISYTNEIEKQEMDRFKNESFKLVNSSSLASHQSPVIKATIKPQAQALLTALQHKVI